MKNLFFSIVFLATFALPSAQANYILGAITQSCGQWTVAQSDEGVYSLKHLQRHALLGYLSGLNNFKKDFLKNTDSDALIAWVNNYCQANPLDNLSDAGLALKNELLKPTHR